MKRILLLTFYLISNLSWTAAPPPTSKRNTSNHRNIIIVTIDGVRWQEVFNGADSYLLRHNRYVADTSLANLLYGANNVDERRKKLMPFFWNYISKKGQLFGNRNDNNKVNVANAWALSYPGYNEIFTGNTDITVATNDKKYNHNKNILEFLNQQNEYKNSVVGFTSWDVFPFIFNNKKGDDNFLLNASYTYDQVQNTNNFNQNKINHLTFTSCHNEEATRNDVLTFQSAKAYLETHQPKVLYLGLGESDEMAHQKKYDMYLQKIQQSDHMIAELWQWVQATDGYKNNTDLIITTDHGRGEKIDTWDEHGILIKGSKQTWMALLGPDYNPVPNDKSPKQLFQKDICRMIDTILKTDFIVRNN